MTWTDPETVTPQSGYFQWELDALRNSPRGGEAVMLPVFARLRTENGRISVIDAVLERSASGRVFMADHERQYLMTERQRDAAEDLRRDVRSILYCHPGEENDDALWEVLHLGPPLALSDLDRTQNSVSGSMPRVGNTFSRPLVAVIDDAIGFLNARFRRTADSTRFRAVWVQSSERISFLTPVGPLFPVVHCGRKFTRLQIDDMLRTGSAEFDTYVALNDTVFNPGTHKGTDRSAGHGTHVLDTAAGADLGSPAEMDAAPDLLAVQLPPAAIGDTSGRRLDPFIVMGLRWTMMQALNAVADEGNAARGVPLIVTLSIGSLAGPKDGTSFLESWMKNMLDTFRALSGDTPVRIVAAYGNAYRSKLCAADDIAQDHPMALDWRIQPDDRTPSFLQLRAAKGRGGALSITLTPPGGAPVLMLPGMLAPGTARFWRNAKGRLIAAVYGEAEAGRESMLFVVAPTEAEDRGVAAPAGAWRLDIASNAVAACPVTIAVERDDTPGGYRPRGRQSWLDHDLAWGWDSERMDWSRPQATGPVTRAGSEVSFSGLIDPALFLVAAAETDRGLGLHASRYSAQGGVGGQPTLSAEVDQGRILSGRIASGVVSGSTLRLSGTSVAAPLLVRRLVADLANGRDMPDAPASGGNPGPVKAALGLRAAPPTDRVGAGVLP